MARCRSHVPPAQHRNRWRKRPAKYGTHVPGFEMLESRVLLNSDPVLIELVVYGSSNVKLEKDVEIISGVLGSDGDVELAKDASTKNIFARGKIDVKKNAIVDGDILGNGNVQLDKGSLVLGNIAAGNSVTLQKSVFVAGDVTAAGHVDLKSGATVGGTITEHGAPESFGGTVLPPINSFAFDPDQDVTTVAGATTTLLPGSYGKLSLQANNVLNLSAGEYFFESVKAEGGLHLALDVSGGEIAVFVAGSVELRKDLDADVFGGTASNVYLETHGSFNLDKDSEWYGTVFAPYEPITLKQDVDFVGAAYSGKQVNIKKDARLELMAANRLDASDNIPPLIDASLLNDTGISSTDGITFDPTLAGIVSDENDVVTLWLSLPEITAATFDVTSTLNPATGAFSLDREEIESLIGGSLPDGTYTFQLTARDEFDNVSSPLELTVILDTASQIPQLTSIDQDTGASSFDGVTNDTTLIISGTAEPESSVAVSEAVLGVIGSTIADATGNWSLDATASPLADGDI